MNMNDLEHIKTPESWKSGTKALWRAEAPRRHSPALRLALAAAAVFVLLMGTAFAAAKLTEFNPPQIFETKDELLAQAGTAANADSPLYIYFEPTETDASYAYDQIVGFATFWSDNWTTKSHIHGATRDMWFSGKALYKNIQTTEGPLWSRMAVGWNGSINREHTAVSAAHLSSLETEFVHMDVSWLEENYPSIPYGNKYARVSGWLGRDWGADYMAVFRNDDACFRLSYTYAVEGEDGESPYLVPDLVEELYDSITIHTTPTGVEFYIVTLGAQVWANCNAEHFSLSLEGVNLTAEETIEILDSLDLTVQWEP